MTFTEGFSKTYLLTKIRLKFVLTFSKDSAYLPSTLDTLIQILFGF